MKIIQSLAVFPLLVIAVVAYASCAYLFGLSPVLFSWHTVGGDVTQITPAMMVIIVATVLLLCELVKSTAIGSRVMIDHALSVLLLMAMLLSYAMVPGFGTETFLLLVLFSLIDVIAGLVISQATARRDIGFGVA